jgi:hypothetical protein
VVARPLKPRMLAADYTDEYRLILTHPRNSVALANK